MKLFSYDNPFMDFLRKLVDLVVLYIIWLVFSLPIVTIGASTTALSRVTLKMVCDGDGYVVRTFTESFKLNFKQATKLWLLLMTVGVILGVDIYFVIFVWTGNTILRNILTGLLVFLAVLLAAIFLYAFALLSQFVNTTKQTVFNAFVMSLRHFLTTLLMLAMNFGVLLFSYTILPFLFVPISAWANSWFLRRIFAKYSTEMKNSA